VTPSTCQTDLSAYLTVRFQDLKLRHEEVGYTLWSGRLEDQKVAIHCVPEWSIPQSDKEALDARIQILTGTDIKGLPRFIETCLNAEHVIFLQEWVEHEPWNRAVLTRETALSLGVELFDLMAELHSRDLLHGCVRAPHLGLDQEHGLLYLFPQLKLPEENLTPDGELGHALEILHEFLTSQEQESLASLKSGREIARRLGRMLSTVKPDQAKPDLVGRDEALGELDRAFKTGGIVTVEAPAGGGKTRLLEEWTESLEARVLQGKASREVAPSPFRLFQSAFAMLEQEMAERPSLADGLKEMIGQDGTIRSALSRHSHTQRSSLVWLAGLLQTLEKDRPTVLILEDVHWADPFTMEFVEYWSGESRRALVVLSCRADEVPPDHAFHRLNCCRISLPRLSDDQAERMLRSVQPGASRVLVESVISRARGNPLLLFQFLRSGSTEGDLYKARVISLSDRTRRTLAVAAVLGDIVQDSVLEHCLGASPYLEEGLGKGLLSPSSSGYRFTHDRLREAFLGELSSQESTDVHLRAADYFAAADRPEAFRVAYHFQMAGKPELGVDFALQAAATARHEHDLSTAIFYFQAALAGLNEDDSRRPEALYKLGDSFRLVGRYAECEEHFLQALAGREAPLERAEIQYALGDVYFKQDKLKEAREVLVDALKSQGENPPHWLHGSFLRQAFILVSGSSRPANIRQRETELLKARLYNRLAYVGWFLEGPVPSIWAHLCEYNIAKKYGDSVELARAQGNHAMAMGAIPLWPRAVEFGRRAVETATRIGDQWCEGAVGHLYGAVLLGSCQLRKARDVLLRAREKIRQTGDLWEENGICYHLAITYYRMGAMEKAAELASQTQRVGVEIKDRLAAGDNLNTLARARNGDFARELFEQEKRFSSHDVQRACELLCTEAIWELRRGNYAAAHQLLQEAKDRYRSKGVQNLYSAPIPCWLVTAIRLELQSSPQESRKLLFRKLRGTLSEALKQARRYRTNLPHALREKALVDILEGNYQSAHLCLKESVEFAQQQGMNFEWRLSCQVWRHFTWGLGALESEAPDLEESEYSWLLGMQPSKPEVGWNELLVAATRISQCLSAPTALHQLCQGCHLVLGDRAECSVVQMTDGGGWRELLGDLGGVVPLQPFPKDGWSDRSIPGFDGRTRLLVRCFERELSDQEKSFLDFLVTVTAAVVDRATRTISSTVLHRDLQRSTDQLSEEAAQLCQAREQLLLSERLALTGRLAAGLVHDLRNLILGINGSVEVLTLDKDGALKELHEILDAGKKSNQLLDRLSGLCKGEILGTQVVHLHERVSESAPLLRSLCGPLVELEFQLLKVPTVRMDPMLLDRILLNLVMNARDAVGTVGEVTVSIEACRLKEKLPSFPHEVPSGTYSVLEVNDDGPGISDEVLPKIFDLHFTTKVGVGTGVGLATVREMVTESGGFITVESRRDGTRFRVFFPSAPGHFVPTPDNEKPGRISLQ
jgi:signal transduction histidine kinase/tetratricopeptide (TPR) repeat protein